MNKTKSIVKALLNVFGLISPLVVIEWSIILLTQLYITSDLPKGIFIIFWIIGCILILIKTLSINWNWVNGELFNHILVYKCRRCEETRKVSS